MPEDNPLGAYLRARRGQLDPNDHGLAPGHRRRVAGLRREEVAELAGLSLSYYVRLEQGRDRHPSPSVLDALARVLHIDEQGRAYLSRLSEQVSSEPGTHALDRPRPELLALLSQWTNQAVLLLGRYRNVLWANDLAAAINPNFSPGENLVREVFLDPTARTTYPDWEQVAEQGVAALRAATGASARDPIRDELVNELSSGSVEFAQMWARQDVREKPSGQQRFHVAGIGTVALEYEPLIVSDGHILYVFFAAPGSTDAALLAEIGARRSGGAHL